MFPTFVIYELTVLVFLTLSVVIMKVGDFPLELAAEISHVLHRRTLPISPHFQPAAA